MDTIQQQANPEEAIKRRAGGQRMGQPEVPARPGKENQRLAGVDQGEKVSFERFLMIKLDLLEAHLIY